MNIKDSKILIVEGPAMHIFQGSTWIELFYDIQNRLIGPNLILNVFDLEHSRRNPNLRII